MEDAFPPNELESATQLLETLLRIDTTNPPGNERKATEAVASVCRSIGLEPILAGDSEARPNLAARWSAAPENRKHRPLVLSCHLDVVPANPSSWAHHPFSGHNDGTYLWGRGAIDMKGFAVMALATLMRLRKEDLAIDRDVIFVAVADEEAGTKHGSKWLVENRPDLLGEKPEYVINEVGGFTVHQDGRRFYPIQVAEKGVAWLRLRFEGKPGHSSLPVRESAAGRLAEAIHRITHARLPWHPSNEATQFIEGFARPKGPIAVAFARQLAHPALGPLLLPLLVSDPVRRQSLEAILRNTATATCLGGGSAINVLPSQAWVDIDGRLAPGESASNLISELQTVIGKDLAADAEFEILTESPAVHFSTETDLYRHLERTMNQVDPDAIVVPSIIPGFTDSRNYASLGADCYGFYPLQLEPDLNFQALFHGNDERIPIEGFHWGIKTLTKTLRSFLSG
ncbi:MAG: M20/M25/M40 family metallo-hydrolase [Verrucomicrobiota bacterium]